MPARQQSAVKRWCFTINNWTVEQYGEVELLFPQHAKYLIVGKEKDEKGTLHLQGYIELNKRLRFNKVRDLFSLSNPHLERARGNPEQNKELVRRTAWAESPENESSRSRSTLAQLQLYVRFCTSTIRTWMDYRKSTASGCHVQGWQKDLSESLIRPMTLFPTKQSTEFWTLLQKNLLLV